VVTEIIIFRRMVHFFTSFMVLIIILVSIPNMFHFVEGIEFYIGASHCTVLHGPRK
jgi:hypothetical protein